MRNKEKEITETADIESVITEAIVCHLAMVDGNKPYVVPISFGYRDGTLFLHTSPKGMKTNILRANPNVCFEFEVGVEMVKAEKACKWDVKYQSVIGWGKACFLDGNEAKREALDIIMGHYSDDAFEYEDDVVSKTAVVRVDIESVTGKQSGQQA
ncbi:pyridoxamine 5'-phosphate oxidase family protein [Candidatus Hydrogenedentota bacterium]